MANKKNMSEEEKKQNETSGSSETNKEIEQEEKTAHQSSKKSKKEKPAEKIKELEDAIAAKTDQYLRLQAEFDNYRKRTLKEKMEMLKTAGESVLINVLPVIDDFERALRSMDDAKDENAVREGLTLIYKRFTDFLKQNGITEVVAIEQDFDTDLHEAITKIPAPTVALKGKIVDVIQKGYMLNDKVIRFAQVVIGE